MSQGNIFPYDDTPSEIMVELEDILEVVVEFFLVIYLPRKTGRILQDQPSFVTEGW